MQKINWMLEKLPLHPYIHRTWNLNRSTCPVLAIFIKVPRSKASPWGFLYYMQGEPINETMRLLRSKMCHACSAQWTLEPLEGAIYWLSSRMVDKFHAPDVWLSLKVTFHIFKTVQDTNNNFICSMVSAFNRVCIIRIKQSLMYI